ncbi:nicotinate-nucleotide--dimethylbenzimidazole phosphoribosyltransferase [Streptomyces sp. NPDC048441]|uniref:nicotinate-nucleotide--dimethylbenzimidazole phosphoribosyltransferase n=1 Tax=Streptomyces sp. NPDC048441 TaxID=3365552 RepID=UPI0037207BE2
MTDTGQVPGEGLPENAGMVEQPGVPAPGAYTYLDPSENPAESVATAEDDDLLLMPGSQGAWSEPQSAQPQPEQPVTAQHGVAQPVAGQYQQQPVAQPVGQHATGQPVADSYPAGQPQPQVVHQPGPHETAGRDSGSVDLNGVQLPGAHAGTSASHQGPARRPLHRGPSGPVVPDGTGSPVRSLADRGPSGAPQHAVPVRHAGPPTVGPEYLDIPRDEEGMLPGPQLGEITPQGATPWTPQPSQPAQAVEPAETVVPEAAPASEDAQVTHGTQGAQVTQDSLAAEAAPTPQPAQAAESPTPQPAQAAELPQPAEATPATPVAPATPETPAAGTPAAAFPQAAGAADPAITQGTEAADQFAHSVAEVGQPAFAVAAEQSLAVGQAAPAPEASQEFPLPVDEAQLSAVGMPAHASGSGLPQFAVAAAQPWSDAPLQGAAHAPQGPHLAQAPQAPQAPQYTDTPAAHAPAPLGQFVPVEGSVPTTPHLAPTPPHPLSVPPEHFEAPAPQPEAPAPEAVQEAAPDAPDAQEAQEPSALIDSAEPAPQPEATVPAPRDGGEPAAVTPVPDEAEVPVAEATPLEVIDAPAEAPEAPEAAAVTADEPEPAPAPEPEAAAPVAEPEPEPAQAAEVAHPAEVAEEPAPADPVPAPAPHTETPAAPAYDDAEREAVLRVMRERRDIRNGFRSDAIPHEVLLRVLEAAHAAPSVGHSQPWDFVVIRSAETRRTMHELAMRQKDAYAKSLPKGRAKQFKELKIEAILDTPVNIVVTADPTRGGRHTLGRHTQPQMAPYSSALAVENFWLAARAEGLGVGWVSFFDEREMVRTLGLPEHLEVVAYLCVGYVDEFPDEPELMQAGWSKRRPLSWVVHEETYGRRALPGEEPHDLLAETVSHIRPLDAKALGEAWDRQKRMTKPPGALGMLEIISAQLSGLSRQCPPPIPEPAAVAIFAGDHGVHAQGVTAWPQEVTAQMVANFLGGGAVCNAFANQVGAEVCVIDVGVASELPATPGLLPRKIRAGTADMTTGPALTREEVKAAIEVGIETARDLVAAGNKGLLTGEMGIANTTASAALISVYTDTDPGEVTGRGTGINDEMHSRKVDVVRRALELHKPDPADPIGVLAAIGGLEHAALVGLLLGGASLRTPVILDGVSAGAAALVARAIAPEVLAACIAGHRSAEPGHVAALNKLGLRPLVDLDLRLGEGTGALLALPVVQSAARAMHEVATFDSAGVTEK